MPTLLADLLLFSVLAAWVTGMVIAIASHSANCRTRMGEIVLSTQEVERRKKSPA